MKMVAEIHQLKSKPAAIHWMCSACGEDASCNCGAPLASKGKRAADAIAANPHRSDRAIAADIGVSQPTVSRARRATDTDVSVDDETRTGLDGKQRRMPVRSVAEDDGDDVEAATPSQLRDSFLIFSNEAMLLAKYEGPIDSDVLSAAKTTASAWSRLVSTMEQRK